jgi:hypothetical protein
MYSPSKRMYLLIFIISMVSAGCTDYVRRRPPSAPPAPVVSKSTPPPAPSAPPSAPAAVKPPAREETPVPAELPSARTVASLQLTDQGRVLLEQGKTDDAISVLERAVSISPTNGQNYYYLAEAWRTKKDTRQAEEFNRLASLYLQGDPEWMVRVLEQRRRIIDAEQ